MEKEKREESKAPGKESIAKMLHQMFEETESVKLVNLKSTMEASQAEEIEKKKLAVNNSQVVLKAVNLQVKLMDQRHKYGADDEGPVEAKVFWEAVLDTPGLGAKARNPRIKEQFEEALKRAIEKE